MRIRLKQLKSLGVETASGKRLGQVIDVIFEIDGQLVAQYEVSPSMLSSKKYLISRDQVVRFEKEKMVVDDNVFVAKDEAKGKQPAVRPEPVVMRENQ